MVKVAARLSLADVDGVMLMAQLQAAKAREATLETQVSTMSTKLETLKANEKAAAAKAAAVVRRSEEVRAKHSAAFDARPANQVA
jgi:predicted  nucleic acid-binding Zn-ribbon protein